MSKRAGMGASSALVELRTRFSHHRKRRSCAIARQPALRQAQQRAAPASEWCGHAAHASSHGKPRTRCGIRVCALGVVNVTLEAVMRPPSTATDRDPMDRSVRASHRRAAMSQEPPFLRIHGAARAHTLVRAQQQRAHQLRNDEGSHVRRQQNHVHQEQDQAYVCNQELGRELRIGQHAGRCVVGGCPNSAESHMQESHFNCGYCCHGAAFFFGRSSTKFIVFRVDECDNAACRRRDRGKHMHTVHCAGTGPPRVSIVTCSLAAQRRRRS